MNEEKNLNAEQLKDVRTSGDPAKANAPVRPVGKVQQGDAKVAGTQDEAGLPEGAEEKKAVMVNPALRGDAGVPYVDEDGENQLEVFQAGKVHFVDAETAELKFNGKALFVSTENTE